MEPVKWHGLERPCDDLCVCIRGAYWDVTSSDVGGWHVRTPDGTMHGPRRGGWATREEARVAAEDIMRKWGVI